jgi:hypothetical protein
MFSNFTRKFLRIIIILTIFMGLFSVVDVSNALQRQPESAINFGNDVYLPLSMKNHPQTKTFGAQIVNLGDATITQLAVDSGIYWARIDAFNWAKIEPEKTNPANYQWDEVDEQSLLAARGNGMHVIALIRQAPNWALVDTSHSCGPIKVEALTDFAEFVNKVVIKYSASPYNIKYWELWNEPDASPEGLSAKSVFGCWGDNGSYYGGVYYGEMLKAIYPVIKEADPEAKVLIGGLLLDCDPSDQGPGGCEAGKFFEGILQTWINEPGDTFDYVNFHGYSYATTPTGQGTLGIDENSAKWGHRGGVVLGKIDFLRDVMESYGVSKPIFHTEGSLICHPQNTAYCNPPDNEFYRSQADYVIWLFVRNLAEGVIGTIWYQFEGPGWRFGGLLDEFQAAKPAYDALQFIISQLGNAEYIGRVDSAAEIRNEKIVGYKFETDLKTIWILWSPDGEVYPVTIPGSFSQALDYEGTEIVVSNNQFDVSSPIYVEFDN